MATTERTPDEAIQLFQTLEQHFPGATLGPEKWQILTIAAITGGGHAEFAKHLYLYLVSTKPEYRSPEQRRALVRRLREALVKLVAVVGVPRPLEAVMQIAEVEREEDRDYSFSREHWQSGPENRRRGAEWLAQIYKQDVPTEDAKGPFAAHRDFKWLSMEITYGLYLSDHSILDGIDTELVVLSGIMIQNLRRETGWHLRGTRRIGVSQEDVELIQQCIEKVAAFCGLNLNKVPRVKDVEHEV